MCHNGIRSLLTIDNGLVVVSFHADLHISFHADLQVRANDAQRHGEGVADDLDDVNTLSKWFARY